MTPLTHLFRFWGATRDEIARDMPGDADVPHPDYQTTLGITIDAPPGDIWPWLVQMGHRRGGLYSYDWLDRLFGFLDAPSAERIIPEFQHLAPGDVIPVGRGAGFPVTAVDPCRSLVMSGERDGFHWTWQFGLYPIDDTRTRLVSRNRARLPKTMGSTFFMFALEPAAFIMTRKMLLGLKRRAENRDALLDRFIPAYDIVERHHIRIDAPAAAVYNAATEMFLEQSPIIRAVFRARELIMRSHPGPQPKTHAFLEQMRSIGWGTLKEIPGREVVMGAVTKPWMADVVFRPLAPDEFAAFCEPDYVKIAWTLRADPRGDGSTFRTETRVAATDAAAWKKFRWYWTFASPGIRLIRWASLRPLKIEAERARA
jgi:hypothetical protein